MSNRRVVITGLGLVTALGERPEPFWQNLLAGKSGVKLIESFDTSAYPVKIGGEVVAFDPANYIDQRSARRIDRFALFALASAITAVNDSGLDMAAEDPDRVGVIVGSGIGGLGELEKEHCKLLERGPDRVSPFCVPKLMVNAASANVSIHYGLRGPNTSVVTACASAAHAVGDAMRQIRLGTADVMLAGGSEAALTRLGLASFCALKALSTRNDAPTEASRPFDHERDGFVLGEGAAVVVLEGYDHAVKRGARIYAELLGVGMTGDGGHITAPDPEGRGACAAMQMALAEAGVPVEQVDYINAHGTGTELNDVSETRAIKKVFGDAARSVAISSIKSHLGHLLGASGAVELVATALAVYHGAIPPTINLTHPDPECDLDYTPLTARQADIQYAMSNSFGFGGHNAAVVVGKM